MTVIEWVQILGAYLKFGTGQEPGHLSVWFSLNSQLAGVLFPVSLRDAAHKSSFRGGSLSRPKGQ